LTTIAEKNLKIKQAKAGVEIIHQANLKIEIISPKESNYSNLNNYSAVLKLTYKKHIFLFMGDAEALIEDEIQSDVNADVIKVGHHGSNTSSSESFVQKVRPQYAVISVGKDNKYHHPNSEILDRWKSVGAEIYRTDEDGTIIAESNGETLTISSVNGKNNKIKFQESKSEIMNNNFQETPLKKQEETVVLQEGVDAPSSKNKITLVNFTDTRKKGQDASIHVKGIPNTKYDISVIYSSGKSTAKGLEEKTSDENGDVSWSWRIGTKTKSGEYPVIISDGTNQETYTLTITEN